MFRINIMTNPITVPSIMAMTKATRTARHAPSAFPAPNSFDTRVLYIIKKHQKKKKKCSKTKSNNVRALGDKVLDCNFNHKFLGKHVIHVTCYTRVDPHSV